jgi:hypothetical protein
VHEFLFDLISASILLLYCFLQWFAKVLGSAGLQHYCRKIEGTGDSWPQS